MKFPYFIKDSLNLDSFLRKKRKESRRVCRDTDLSAFFIYSSIPPGGLQKKTGFDNILTLEFNAEDLKLDKLLDEIESYWSTRTEGYSEVNEKELKGMQKKAWLDTL